MTTRGLKAIAGFVVLMAVIQIFFEDIMMFFATTGSGPPAMMNSPYVMVGIPLAISLTLLLVLIGGALIKADTLR